MTDHSRDFDFQRGQWIVHHRRLKQRLTGCTEWEEFGGTCAQFPVLGGNGNIEDNLLHLPAGDYRAVAIRSFDAASGNWAIWWLDQRAPHSLEVPVIGKFEDGVGTFLAEDVLDDPDRDLQQQEQARSGAGPRAGPRASSAMVEIARPLRHTGR